jgi:hypothetical protein
MFRGMFKTPKHRQFTYKPRYYDPIKDELEERIKARELRNSGDRKAREVRIREGLRSGVGRGEARRRGTRKSNMMIIIIALILTMMIALFLNYGSFIGAF